MRVTRVTVCQVIHYRPNAFFWLVFPAAVEPPVLGWVIADELFDCLSIFGCDPQEGVFFVGPFVGENDAFYADFEKEAVFDSSAVADDDGDIVCQGKQADAFIGACFSAEKVNEDSLFSGILVGDKAEGRSLSGDFVHHFCGAFFVDDFLSCPLADAVEIIADESVIEWSCDAIDVEAEEAHHIADNLEVAVMSADENEAFALSAEPLGPFGVYEPRVLPPVIFPDKPGGENDIDRQHRYMLEAALSDLLIPLPVFVRVTCAEIVERAISAAMVMPPEEATEKTGEPQIGLDVKQKEERRENSQGGEGEPVEDDVTLFLFLLFLYEDRVGHRGRF